MKVFYIIFFKLIIDNKFSLQMLNKDVILTYNDDEKSLIYLNEEFDENFFKWINTKQKLLEVVKKIYWRWTIVIYLTSIRIHPQKLLHVAKKLNYQVKILFAYSNQTSYLLQHVDLMMQFKFFREMYIGEILGSQIHEIRVNGRNLVDPYLLYNTILAYRKRQFSQYSILYINEVLELFLVGAIIKDLTAVQIWMKRYLQRLHFKRHKQAFYLLKFLLESIIWARRHALGIHGCRLVIKGKLGRGGSVRKSKFIVKCGVMSRTTKSLRLWFRKFNVWTKSGIIGVFIGLTF